MASVVVSEKYKTLANSLTRQVETQAVIYDYLTSKKEWRYGRTYNDKNGIVSWSITGGKQSGAFEIGTTICKSLEIEFQRGATIGGNAKIDIQVRFVNPADLTDVSEWLSLGQFYADKITVTETSGIKKVVAMDYMLQLEKSYRTDKVYPLTASLIVGEIAQQARFETAEDISYVNDTVVVTFPYEGQSQVGLRILYSRRRIIGFIASLQAGNAFFTRDGKLDFTDYSENENDIDVSSCFNATLSGAPYDITDVIWEEEGVTTSRDKEDSYQQVFFKNPFEIRSDEKFKALDNIKSVLVGKNIRQISFEKQGTGFYEIGETVTIIDGETKYKVIISGIKYSMTSGGFRETIFSVASSETESNYDGGYSSTSSGGSNSITSILYQRNENPMPLTESNQELFVLQFSSVSNASVAAAWTLNPNISEAGAITSTVYIDQQEYGTFVDEVEEGYNVVTVVCPLVGLPSGGHTLSVQVQATASGVCEKWRNYLTVFANGVATEAGFTGTLQLKQKLGWIVTDIEDVNTTILPLTEKISTSTQYTGVTRIHQSISAIISDTEDVTVHFTPFSVYLGGKNVALFDKNLSPIYDVTQKRVFAVNMDKEEEK